jgi:hypothetical protein
VCALDGAATLLAFRTRPGLTTLVAMAATAAATTPAPAAKLAFAAAAAIAGLRLAAAALGLTLARAAAFAAVATAAASAAVAIAAFRALTVASRLGFGRRGFRGFSAEEVLQPADEAGGFLLRDRRRWMRLVRARLEVAGFATLTRLEGAALAFFAGLARLEGTRLASLAPRFEDGPFVAVGGRFRGIRRGLPLNGRATCRLRRQNLQLRLLLFRRWGSDGCVSARSCRRARRWRRRCLGGRRGCGRGWCGQGGLRGLGSGGSRGGRRLVGGRSADRGFPGKRIPVFGWRSDDLDGGRLVATGTGSGGSGSRLGRAFATGQAGTPRAAKRRRLGRRLGGRARAGISGGRTCGRGGWLAYGRRVRRCSRSADGRRGLAVGGFWRWGRFARGICRRPVFRAGSRRGGLLGGQVGVGLFRRAGLFWFGHCLCFVWERRLVACAGERP